MAQFVGTVSKLTGVAHARAEDGTMRELRLGDDVYQGEVLVTARGTVVQVSVPDAPSIVLPGERELLLNGEVTVANSDSADESVLDEETLDSLVAALESGEGDLLDGLEATAAGAGNEGSSFVRLGRIGYGLSELTELNDPNGVTEQELSSSEFDPDLALLQTDDDVEIEIPEPEPEPEDEPPVNASPDAVDDAFSGEFDTELQGNVLPNDTDPEGDALTVTGNSQPANGEVLVNADGSFTYVPNQGFSGSDSFTYTISDGNGGTDTATVSITVAEEVVVPPPPPPPPVNEAPDALDDAVSTEFGTPVSGSVLPNDSDPEGDALTITGNTEPANGSLVFNADGTFTYTPSDGFSGDDTFTYTISDGNGGTDTATVSITVAEEVVVPPPPPPPPVNEAPDALDDAVSTEFGTPVSGSVLPNDSDPEGDALTITGNTEPANGSLVFNADGTFTYTPSDGFSGDDTFTYTISDGNGGTDTATVSITVAEEDVNTPPVAADDTQSTGENSAVTINILANDSDADGALNPASVAIISGPSNGSVTVNADGTVTYTPNDDYIGADLFTYSVADNDGDVSNIANVSLSVDNTRNVSSFTDNWVDGVEYYSYASEADYINNLDPVVSGLTGDQGRPGSFSWDDGEFIVFKIGSVVIGEFSADQLTGDILFIHDIAGLALSNTNANQLENTAIFLQALDADLTDGDLSDGLQTNQQLNTAEAFANGITITAETRAAFADYVDPTTEGALDLQTAGKGMISDALATRGIEFTRLTEADPDTSDGNQNVFETQAIQHVTDTVLQLADTVAGGERLADDFEFDGRLEDVINAGDGFITYSSEFLSTVGTIEEARLAFDSTGLLANANPQQVAIRENMEIEIPEGTLAQITLADGTTRIVGEVVYDDEGREGYIQLRAFDGQTGITDQEIDDGLLESVSFNYTIWDWTARETVSLKALDTYKSNLSAEITNVVEGETIEFVLSSSLIFETDQQLTVKFSPEGNGFNFAEYADDFTVPIEYSTDGGVSWQAMDQVDSYFAPPYDLPLPVFGFTLPAGSDSILVRIQTFDDVFDEDPVGSIDSNSGQGIEVIDMTIEGENFYTENLQPGIIDNDPTEVPYVKSDFQIVYEHDGEAVFTITLYDANGNPVEATEDVVISYQTSDLGARAGEDYTAVSGTVTITAGSSTATVAVPIIDDLIIENPDPEFALLNLTGISGSYGGQNVVIGDSQGSLRIYDNDAGVFSVSDVSVIEGAEVQGEGQGVLVTVTRFGAGLAEGDQSVTLSTIALGAGDTAEAGDFGTVSVTVDFAPGESEKTVFIPISDDAIVESAETFRVELSNPTNGASISESLRGQTEDGEATVTIVDNDQTTFSVDSVEVSEGGLMTFTVTRTGDSVANQTIDFATSIEAGDSAEPVDFTPASGTLTFALGESSKTFTVQTTADDVYEGDETFTVTLSNNSLGSVISQATAAGTIVDDGTGPDPEGPEGPDDDTPVINVSGPLSVNEGDGVATFTISLSNASEFPITVDYATVDGTAVAGSDFTAASGSVTFAPGETSMTVDVPITDDSVVESDEAFSLDLSNVQGDALIGSGSAETAILDNEGSTTFNVQNVSVSEGSTATITVTRSGDAQSEQTVEIATLVPQAGVDSAEASDFVANTATLTFAAGQTTATFTVDTTSDDVYEGAETFRVELSNPSEGAQINDGTGVVTILDDGNGPDPDGPEGPDDDRPSFSINDVTVDESAGTITFTVTKTGDTELDSSVNYAVSPGTATNPEDYTPSDALTGTLSFAAGVASQTVTLAITDDVYAENQESFTVQLSSPSGAIIADGIGSGIINDDADVSTVTLSSSDVNEGSDITVTATVDNAPQTTDLVLTLNNGETITIAAGATQGSVTFANPNGSDDVVDGETLTYSIASGAGGNYESLDTSDTVDVVVSDDPLGGVTVDLTATASLVEGNDITYTATLSGGTAGNDITVTLANGEAITIEAGQTSGSTTAATREDEEYIQGTATITNSITTVVETSSDAAPKLESVAAAADTSVSTSVTDDADVSTVTLSSSDVNEGSDITVTATVDNAPQTTDLVLTLNNGETITIAAGATQGSVTFANPNGSDDVVDGETLTYSIASGAGGNYESLNTDDTVDVVVSDALSATVSGDIATQDADVLANTTDSGTAQVTGTGGSGGYTYAFADTAVTSVVAGDFSIDANGLVTFTQDAAYQHDPNSDQANNVYSIDVVITDSDGNSVTRTVDVDITDDTPHLAPFGGSDEVAMGGSVVIDSSANSSFGGDGPGYYTLTTSTDGVASLTENNGVWTGYHSNGDALFNLALTEDGWLFTSIARLSEQTPVQLNSGSIGAFSPTGEVIIGDLTISSPDGSINGTGNGIGVGTSGNDAEFDFGDHMTFAFEGPQTSVEVGMSGSKAGTVTAVFYDADGNVIETQSGLVFDKATGSSPPSPIALATSQGTAFYAVTIEHTADNNGSNKVEFIEYNQVSASDAYSFVVLITDADGDQSSANFNVSVVSANPPIAVDIAGDGVDYLPMDAGVVFTDQSTGESVNTAWVGPEDGMLVIDANNSGTVDEAREYVFTEWSETAKTDMEAVAEVFDTNQDGVLDAQDERFDEFAVWQDADSDGVTDEGELTSLTDLGIESIALNYAEDSESGTAADGDVVIHGQSEVVFTDGTTTTAEDTSFAISAADVISDEGDLALPASEEAALVPGASDAEAGGRSGEFDTLMVEADLMLNSNRDEGVDDSSNQ